VPHGAVVAKVGANDATLIKHCLIDGAEEGEETLPHGPRWKERGRERERGLTCGIWPELIFFIWI
jgi:hypothetical protein